MSSLPHCIQRPACYKPQSEFETQDNREGGL